MPPKEIRNSTAEQVRGIDVARRRLTVVISTFDLDSHGTRIDQNGWEFEVFRKNPVIPLAHDDRGFTGSNGLPVAKGLPDTIRVENQKTYMDLEFPEEEVFPLADTVWELARGGFINAVSVGFEPLDWEDVEEDDQDGHAHTVRIYRKQRLLEVSIVTIPSNSNALVQRARKLGRENEIENYRTLTKRLEAAAQEDEPIRWNRALSARFDVCDEKIDPAELQYDWVAKHIGCEVKQVHQNSFSIPSYRIGGFLSGLRHALLGSQTTEVRNLTYSGRELPPVYNVIQLSSLQSEDFLVEGMAFCNGTEGKFAYRVCPVWGGLHMDFFTHRDAKDFNRQVVSEAWRFARENNPLKGEAFALSGEFIRATDESWEDCFLEEKNEKAIKRIVDRVNAKGKDMPNRGVILMGPPGTGKTLCGRIIRNTIKECSFIWVSTRDFHYGGGFSQAFELAREIAPSVLFFEDIDNWVGGNIDLLKTEMDGIAKSTGVVTVMTTNFPERLPEALIDRPGRFHDVLNFNLPTAEKRAAMLRKWIDGLSHTEIEDAVEKTKGFSGAHMYELANFTRNLQEADELSVGVALQEALTKIEEQRALIDKTQLQGSNYRPKWSRGMRVDRDSGRLEPHMQQVVSHDLADVEKWRSYFEQKQPINKKASAVLKKFYAKVLKSEPPADEGKAWDSIGEAVDALEESSETKPEDVKPEEAKPDEKPQEAAPEEPSKPEPPAEAPQDARKASVPIPLSAVGQLPENLRRALIGASEEALRQGIIPVSSLDAFIDRLGDKLAASMLQ
ncbi:MAG: AAA family ATPase [Pirellulales bacterium]